MTLSKLRSMTHASLRHLRLNAWQRMLVIGLLVTLSSQIYLSILAEGFRVSAAPILFPVLLVIMMRDSHRPDAGLVTCLCVMVLRTLFSVLQGTPVLTALLAEYPGGVFYLCYDVLLCVLIRDRRNTSIPRLWLAFFLCELVANLLNLALSSPMAVASFSSLEMILLMAVGRPLIAAAILWVSHSHRHLLLREEHEHRYRHLFLMTAELKTELYFLKKDAEDIEAVMAHAYQLHEQLDRHNAPQELIDLALSIARDVHEVKKDNLRIIRGIEEEVAGAYDHETMSLADLFHILEVSTRQILGAQRANIRLECHYDENLSIREHYRLLSILKNLVTNAAEAIHTTKGRGTVRLDCRAEADSLVFLVEDDGPGISPRGMKLLFQVGYSTKFNPNTGDINRGMGLPAVQYIVEELGGTIQVQSAPNQGTCFQVTLPLTAVTGGEV